MFSLSRRLTAEALGTALLLAIVVGSGIMAERLSGDLTALALLANTIATGAGLIALILTLGPISGAHFNPIVSLSEVLQGKLNWRDGLSYSVAQVVGGIAGVWLAHAMFELPLWQLSQHARTGSGQWLAEAVASFGLIAVIISTTRHRASATPFAVAAFITAAYWFTASTSFANPAVTLARALTDSFAGIRLADVPGFMMAQVMGALAALALMNWLFRAKSAQE
ncbi:MAG: MIP/aquaporin family protein [Pseudomonadota bacterium]